MIPQTAPDRLRLPDFLRDGSLLSRHLELLVKWEDARRDAWQARVARKPKDVVDELERIVEDAAANVERLKQDVADDLALRLRMTAEVYPHLDIRRLRDNLDDLADATLGKRGAA